MGPGPCPLTPSQPAPCPAVRLGGDADHPASTVFLRLLGWWAPTRLQPAGGSGGTRAGGEGTCAPVWVPPLAEAAVVPATAPAPIPSSRLPLVTAPPPPPELSLQPGQWPVPTDFSALSLPLVPCTKAPLFQVLTGPCLTQALTPGLPALGRWALLSPANPTSGN